MATDLQSEFPDLGGFSKRNIFRIRAFYLAYEKVTQAVAQIHRLPIFNIPWGHNTVLMEKIKNNDERIWYTQKTIENGWSRSLLEASIKTDLYKREGKAITNFKKTLPPPQSGVAQQTIKDPYLFDFLSLSQECDEHDIEQSLINNVQKLLLEMGKGVHL